MSHLKTLGFHYGRIDLRDHALGRQSQVLNPFLITNGASVICRVLQMPRRGEIHRSFLEMRTRRTLTSRPGYCQVLPELARMISASTDDLKGSGPITPGFIPRLLARLVRFMPRFNLFGPPPIDPALATLSSEEKLASPLPASPHRCKRDRKPDHWFGTTGVRRQGSTCDNARRNC